MAIDLSRRSRPQQYTALIESKKKLTEHVYLVNFKLQNPPTISFLPGQTISLHVDESINRSMSVASPPSDNTHILMCHDVKPMGPGSQWTVNHNEGDVGTFMAPLGIFILDQSQRKKVLVATGTGVAPFRSMLLDHFSPDAAGPKTTEFSLYWGLRHEEDVYWKEEFETLAAKYPNFRFVLTLSQPGETWTGVKGRVTDHVTQEEKDVTGSEFYLCGNKGMVKDMEEQLLAANVPKEQIYKELYF